MFFTDLVLPHVGWNRCSGSTHQCPGKGIPEGGDMYFVHSYAFHPTDPACMGLQRLDYGQQFTAVVGRGSCYGVQFHPKKPAVRSLSAGELSRLAIMLKRRLIPKLQLGLRSSFRGIQPVLVVTRQFGSRRAIGDPLSQAKIYEAQLADELILVDLERSDESWPLLLSTVEAMAEALATPLAVGGGIQSFEQVQALLDRGADKVVLNTAALQQPELIDRVANAYGAQCVVLSLDASPSSGRVAGLVSGWSSGWGERPCPGHLKL